METTCANNTKILPIPLTNLLDETLLNNDMQNGITVDNEIQSHSKGSKNTNGTCDNKNKIPQDKNEIVKLNDTVPIDNTPLNVPIDNTTLNVFKHEIQNLYTYINKNYSDLNLRIDSVCTEIHLIETSLKEEIYAIKLDDTMSTLQSRCLIIEEDIGCISKQIENVKKRSKSFITDDQQLIQNEISRNIEKTTNELRREVRENLKNANIQHKQFINFKKEFEAQVMPTLNRINNGHMKNGNSTEPISSTLDQKRTVRPGTPNEEASDIMIDCDVLFLGDSNLNHLKTDIMDYGTKCEKIICVHLSDVYNVIDKGNIKRDMKSVYMQCGTNNLDHDNTEKVKSDMENVINRLKAKFPNSNIVVSSLLPRMDRKPEILQINEFLHDLCDSTRRLTFMDNRMITEEMLVDRKHLNNDGFRILLGNIRFMLFGKIPIFKKIRNLGRDSRSYPRSYKTNFNREHGFSQDRVNQDRGFIQYRGFNQDRGFNNESSRYNLYNR